MFGKLTLSAIFLLNIVMIISVQVFSAIKPVGILTRPISHEYKKCQKLESSNRFKSNQFIQELMKVIYTKSEFVKNKLESLYPLSSFCVSVENKNQFGGDADPASRSIVIYSKTITSLKSVDEVAAILAHELSHVILQHVSDFDTSIQPVFPFVYTQNKEFVALQSKYSQLNTLKMRLEQEMRDVGSLVHQTTDIIEKEKLKIRFQQIRSELSPIKESEFETYSQLNKVKNLILPHSYYLGWAEQEADENAMEILDRVGFSRSGIVYALKGTMSESSLVECNMASEPVRIKSSLDTHPSLCWRAWNLIQFSNLQLSNQNDYSGSEGKLSYEDRVMLEKLWMEALEELKL